MNPQLEIQVNSILDSSGPEFAQEYLFSLWANNLIWICFYSLVLLVVISLVMVLWRLSRHFVFQSDFPPYQEETVGKYGIRTVAVLVGAVFSLIIISEIAKLAGEMVKIQTTPKVILLEKFGDLVQSREP